MLRRTEDRARATVLVASLGFFVVVLDTTIVNVALPDVDRDLDAGVSGLQWVVDGYTVVFAALLLSAGALSDRVGAHRAFTTGMAVFAVSSAACALAPSVEVLVASRVVQGFGAAVIMPSSLAIVSTAYSDPDEQRRAISLWTVAGALAITAGPVVGGLFTEGLGWRSVFLINLPIGAAGLAAARILPRTPPRPARLDIPGQVLAVLTLGLLTVGVIEGGHDGFGEPYVVAALASAALAGVTFVWVERRGSEPLLPLHLFAAPAAATAIAFSVVLFGVFYGQVFVLSLLFQDVMGHSPAEAGLLFLPMTLLVTVTTICTSRMVARFGTWVPLILGTELLAAGFLALVAVDGDSSILLISIALVPTGVGMALAGPPIPMALMAALPPERAGLASGVFNASRQVGATLGVAIFGVFVSGSSFTDGMHEALLLGVAGLAIAAVFALVYIRPRAPVAPVA